MNKIFVQIASYRDPELKNTIEDCLEKAKNPENIVFGIAWQHSKEDSWDNIEKYKNKENFRILDFDWKESKGVCWARSQIQKLYKDEDFTLQLDSHHRFIENWDEILIEMLLDLEKKSEKPIISSYATVFIPKDDDNKKEELKNELYHMGLVDLSEDGGPVVYPHYIQDFEKLKEPFLAHSLSGHFIFTRGFWIKEVPYDPYLYFYGEEPTLALRSFTHGYDLFHPHKIIIWHEYTRSKKIRHWDDFNEQKNPDLKPFYEFDHISKKRMRQILGCEPKTIDFGIYDIGNERSVEEYENLIGVDFKNQTIHEKAKNSMELPIVKNKEEREWRKEKFFNFNLKVSWSHMWDLIKQQGDVFDFIFFGVANDSEKVSFREDLTSLEMIKGEILSKRIKFKAKEKPTKIVMWPHLNGEWLERIVGEINILEEF